MKLKEHSIFKSYMFLTLEEEEAWKEDIAMCMNDVDCKEDGTDYTADDPCVFDRFLEDIWEIYDCEKDNLNVELPNNIIAIADVGRWDGRRNGSKIMNSNLNEVLFLGRDHEEANIYYDRYDVHAELVHHDGRDYATYRMVKEGIDPEWLFDKQVYGDGLTKQEITKYTKSLVPYVKKAYGIK